VLSASAKCRETARVCPALTSVTFAKTNTWLSEGVIEVEVDGQSAKIYRVSHIMNQQRNNNRGGKANAPGTNRKERRKNRVPIGPLRSDGTFSDNSHNNRRYKDRSIMPTQVASRITRTGISDFKRCRLKWVLGYTFVGNGTNGTLDAVYLKSASGTFLVNGLGSGVSGWAPVAAADLDFGQTYVSDIEKHYARKVVRRMWLHVDSLNPTTNSSMMAAIGLMRGASGAEQSTMSALATATVPANTVNNVCSTKGGFTVASWENKTVDITEFIGGGSGANQNEFDLQTGQSAGAIYTAPATKTSQELDGVVPACICVAGQALGTTFNNSNVHQLTIEQEVDYLDYIGGMNLVATA